MSEPNLLLQAGPQAQNAEQSLWHRAPGWRNLTLAASILTLAAVATLVFLPQPVGINQPIASTEHDAVASPLDTTSLAAQPVPAAEPSGPPQTVPSSGAPASAVAPDLPVGTIIVSPGMLTKINQHRRYSRGQDWPIAITIISPPAHGTISTQDTTALMTYTNGVARITPVKQVFYKSDPGYTGIDKFTYKRISGDEVDLLNTNTYEMTVFVE